MTARKQLSTQVRLPPALFKRVRELAVRHGLEYGAVVQRLVDPKVADPVTQLLSLQEYLKRYGRELEDAIEAVNNDPRVVQEAVEVLAELEQSFRRAFRHLPGDELAVEEVEETEGEDDE
jgi:hypothetical protein